MGLWENWHFKYTRIYRLPGPQNPVLNILNSLSGRVLLSYIPLSYKRNMHSVFEHILYKSDF